MSIQATWKPLPLGGRDQLLRIFRQLTKERRPAGKIQFAENVVQEQKWRLAKMRFQKTGGGKAQRENQRALLAFRALGSRPACEGEREVVPVGTHGGLAQACVLSLGSR